MAARIHTQDRERRKKKPPADAPQGACNLVLVSRRRRR